MEDAVQYAVHMRCCCHLARPGAVGQSRGEAVQNASISETAHCGPAGGDDEAALALWTDRNEPEGRGELKPQLSKVQGSGFRVPSVSPVLHQVCGDVDEPFRQGELLAVEFSSSLPLKSSPTPLQNSVAEGCS